jgi:3-oxoacyl-[acyl-carrier protein] reductase
MELKLDGKLALVTGGSRGIGRAIAERLVDAGATVAICGQDRDNLSKALKEIGGGKITGMTTNVASESAVSELFAFIDKELGGLDILVNNAGVGSFATLADMTPEEWHRIIDTNLSGVYYCCHHAIPRMRQRGGGSIINISSLAARNPFAGGAAYNASKFGLNGLTEAVMLDHRNEKIRLSTVMPGSVSTDFGSASKADWKIAPEDVADAVAMILAMPERTLISRVELRPSRPAK